MMHILSGLGVPHGLYLLLIAGVTRGWTEGKRKKIRRGETPRLSLLWAPHLPELQHCQFLPQKPRPAEREFSTVLVLLGLP